MDTWLSFFKDAPEAQLLESPQLFADMLALDFSKPHVAAIQANLSQSSTGEINRAVDNANIMDGDWTGFVSLCKAYLHWCALADPNHPETSFETYAKVLLALLQAFNNKRGSALNLLIQNTVRTINKLFARKGKLYTEWLATCLLKLFNSVRSERELPPWKVSKKENSLFYANMISRLYFQSEQFVSAGNVFKNMYSLEVRLSQFPMSEQVEYRYWLGRYSLYINQLESAYIHLQWAWNHCPPQFSAQSSRILVWLVLPSTLIGQMPSKTILDAVSPSAQAALQLVIQAMKTGEYPPQYAELIRTNEWILQHHLLPLLEKYLPLLVYRKGIDRLIKLSELKRLPLKLCMSAFHLSPTEDPQLILSEGICVSLITKGLLKASVLPRSQIVAIKPSGSVPKLGEYYNLSLSPRENWLTQ